MPTQNIEYEDKCTNITTTLCTPVIRTLVLPEQDGSGDESEEGSGVVVEGEGSGVDESEIVIEVNTFFLSDLEDQPQVFEFKGTVK